VPGEGGGQNETHKSRGSAAQQLEDDVDPRDEKRDQQREARREKRQRNTPSV